MQRHACRDCRGGLSTATSKGAHGLARHCFPGARPHAPQAMFESRLAGAGGAGGSETKRLARRQPRPATVRGRQPWARATSFSSRCAPGPAVSRAPPEWREVYSTVRASMSPVLWVSQGSAGPGPFMRPRAARLVRRPIVPELPALDVGRAGHDPGCGAFGGTVNLPRRCSQPFRATNLGGGRRRTAKYPITWTKTSSDFGLFCRSGPNC